MGSLYSLSVLDYSKEDRASSVRFNITTLNAGNYVAVGTAVGALQSAIDAVIVGNLASDRIIAVDNFITRARPASPAAQRENKWLLIYEDNTTHRLYRNELPTADLTLLTGGSDFISDLTVAPWAAFKTAFEAVVLSPAGNATTLREVQFVGKRL